MSELAALSREAGGVASSVAPSVVTIGRDRRGAGAVISEGRVVTNAHNLRGSQVTVTFADGRVAVGSVVGADLDADLAVVDVDTNGAPALEWSDEDVGTGALVFAVTNGPGGGPRLTWGLVSATGQAFRGPRGRRIADALEHTAPLARGSSGGPLVDADGRLVGINTHRRGDGFYLAVRATTKLQEALDSLGRGESPAPVTLGIGVAPAHVARRLRSAVGLPPQDGLLVRGVEEGSPASRAGVRTGDLVIEAGGQPVASSDDLYAILDALAGDATLTLRIVRGSEHVSVAVTFGATGEEGSV